MQRSVLSCLLHVASLPSSQHHVIFKSKHNDTIGALIIANITLICFVVPCPRAKIRAFPSPSGRISLKPINSSDPIATNFGNWSELAILKWDIINNDAVTRTLADNVANFIWVQQGWGPFGWKLALKITLFGPKSGLREDREPKLYRFMSVLSASFFGTRLDGCLVCILWSCFLYCFEFSFSQNKGKKDTAKPKNKNEDTNTPTCFYS